MVLRHMDLQLSQQLLMAPQHLLQNLDPLAELVSISLNDSGSRSSH